MVRNFHGFTEGNWYIYTGTKREDNWSSEGEMDFALDHFPVECIEGSGDGAMFEDQIGNVYGKYWGQSSWDWEDGFDNWIEIKDPNEEYRIEQGEFLYNSNSNTVEEGMIRQYASGNPNYVLTRPPFSEKSESIKKQFKVGDRVKIVRKFDKADLVWLSAMDNYIGNECIISGIDGNCFQFERGGFWFPFECAELIKENKEFLVWGEQTGTPSVGHKSKFQAIPQLYATVTETRFDTPERIVSLGELAGKAILKSNIFVNKKRKFKKL